MDRDYVKELNIIAKTRLFFRSLQELNEYTGLCFSQGNNAGKVSFERRYRAYSKLSELADELSDGTLTLGETIDSYLRMTDLVNDEHLKSKNKDNNLVFWALNQLMSGELSQTLDVAILVLILLGLLPNANTNKGVSNTTDIESDFIKMFDFLSEYISELGDEILSTSPIVQTHRNDFEQVIRDKQELWISRFGLISRTFNILREMLKLSTVQNRADYDASIKWVRPDIEGVWCVSDHLNLNDFWLIEKDDFVHFVLSHYRKFSGKVTHEAFVLGLNEVKDDLLQMVIMGPAYQRTIVEGSSATNEVFKFIYEPDTAPTKNYPKDDGSVKKIELYTLFNPNSRIPFDTLYRVEEPKIFDATMDQSVNIVDPKYRSYITGYLCAITLDYLYLYLLDCDKEILGTEKTYLKIPRTGNREIFTDINSKIYLAQFCDGAIFLTFDPIYEFFEITNSEVFDELGLEFSDVIE